jgi:predicted SAM-dependent methyltransferase
VSIQPDTLHADFCAYLSEIRGAIVVEMGARRFNPDVPTLHRSWVPADARLIGTDFADGMDVDVLADAHALSSAFAPASIDAVIANSVFEHFQRPWIVAAEIAKVLKVNGQIWVYTHFVFPEHGFPNDYWRFTREGLETIFVDAGLHVIGSNYHNPCRITSELDPNTSNYECFTGVYLSARKLA